MRKKYPDNKLRKKITATIDNGVIEALDEYIKDNNIYNRSELIEKLIINEIKKDGI
jgi:metal-responsive CopG/Arc/MetJ family transcriptional regulator